MRIVWDELAVTVTLPASVRAAPSWTSDWVVSVMMFRASDAPMPRLPPVAGDRRAPRRSCRSSCSGRSPRHRRRGRRPKRRLDQGLAGVRDDVDRHRPGHADVARPGAEVALAPNGFIGLAAAIPALTVTPSALIVEAPMVASAEALDQVQGDRRPDSHLGGPRIGAPGVRRVADDRVGGVDVAGVVVGVDGQGAGRR